MLTSFPTYSLYQLSYTCNFLNCITLPFRILFSQFIYCYSIAYSVRRVGFHSYNLLSALLPTSIRIFLNAGSFFANLPAVSGVSLTLARKILYRVMASVESDYTAHVIFKVQKESFLNILSLITAWKHQNVVHFKKILSLIKPDRRILPTSFCNNLQKVFILICTFAFMRTFIVLLF